MPRLKGHHFSFHKMDDAKNDATKTLRSHKKPKSSHNRLNQIQQHYIHSNADTNNSSRDMHSSKEYQEIQEQMRKLKAIAKETTDGNEKLRIKMSEKETNIQFLLKRIKSKDEELEKFQTIINKLIKQNQQYKEETVELQQNVCNLETDFDRNVENFSSENEQLRKQMEELELARNEIENELICKRQKWEVQLAAKCEEITNSQAQLKNEKTLLEENKKKLVDLQNMFEDYKNNKDKEIESITDELRAKIIDLNMVKEELKDKNELIGKHQLDRKELEESKNKIIDELKFKINEAERIFDQPLRRIQPIRVSTPPIASASIVTDNNKENPSTSRIYRFRRQQSTQRESQRAAREPLSPTNETIRQNPTVPLWNEFSSDDDDDIRQTRPNFPALFKSNSIDLTAGISAQRRFCVIARKRKSPDDDCIPGTSESDNAFDQIKNTRN